MLLRHRQNGYLRRFRDAYHRPINCESRNNKRLYQNSYQELFDAGGVVYCFRKNELNVRHCLLLLKSRLIELYSL